MVAGASAEMWSEDAGVMVEGPGRVLNGSGSVVLSDAAADIHAEPGPNHRQHKRRHESDWVAQIPARVAACRCTKKSVELHHA